MNPTWLYVAIVYAVAIAIARRSGVLIPKRVAALFYVLTLVWFFRPMTGPYINAPTDILQLIPPWSANAPPGFDRLRVSNFEGQDVVFQMIPWAHAVRRAWLSLRPPLWNNFSGAGLPLLGNMMSEGLSPLRLLVLPLTDRYLLTGEGALKVLSALTFTFLFCRRRYDANASFGGALAFGFGTWLSIWLHFPLATVGAFLPAVLHQIDLLAERGTFGRITFAAFLGPVIIFGGHPETAAHIVFYATLYAAWMIVELRSTERAYTFIRSVVIAGALAALLAAPVLAPFIESMRRSVRYHDRQTQPHRTGTAYSDFPSMTATVQPRFFGTRPAPAWGPANSESICGFAGFLGVAAWFGLAARALSQRRFRDHEMFLVLASVLAWGLMDDWPIISPPFRALFSLALNARVRLMFCLLCAAMTAAVIHHARRERIVVAASIAGGLLVLAMLFARTHFPGADAKSVAIQAAMPSVVTLLLAGLLLVRKAWRAGAAAVAASLFIELWITAHHWNPVRPLSEFYPRTPIIDALSAAQRSAGEPYRMSGIGAPLFPNMHMMLGFEDARLLEPVSVQRYAQFLRLTTQYDTREYYPKLKDANAPVLDYLNVRWLLTEPSAPIADTVRYRELYAGRDGRLYENRNALSRFFSPKRVMLTNDVARNVATQKLRDVAVVSSLPVGHEAGEQLLAVSPAPPATIMITKYSGDAYDLAIDATRWSLVASSVTWWPGWRITNNGKSLHPILVNGAFIGFVVPPGHSDVRIRYVPVSFWGGSALALITIAGIGLAGWRRPRSIIRAA